MLIKGVYYFNSARAFSDCLRSGSNDIFFYDGALLEEAPKNCVNVPMSTFYEYFLHTLYPQVSQVNFDGMEFSDDIKNQITDSLQQAVVSIQKQKIQIITELLPKEIDESNVNVMLLCFLQFCRDNEELNEHLVLRLLDIVNFLDKNSVVIDELVKEVASHIAGYLQEDNSLLHLHLVYCARVVTQDELAKQKYFKSLADYPTLLEMINNFKFIKTLFGEDKFQEYIENFSQALFDENFIALDILEQKKKIFKLYYLSVLNYARSRTYKCMYDVLYKVYKSALENGLDELVFYLYTPLIMSWNEDEQTQDKDKIFNENIEKPLEAFIKDKLVKKYNLSPNNRKIKKNKKQKVAFLIDRVIPYSIYNVFYDLLKHLKQNPSSEYEFVVYNLNFIESASLASTVDELKELGFKYIDLHQEIVGDDYPFYSIVDKAVKVRQRLIDDRVDVLVGINSRPEYNFLFTTRTAPKQVYWSHGNNEYDIQGIDIKIAHGGLKGRSDFEPFSINLDGNKYLVDVDEEAVQDIRNKYPKDSFILGTIGRLIKIDDDEYLNAVAKIMKQNPQTIYLACGSGEDSKIKQKVKELGLEDRFFFTGYVDADIYAYVIDLWLEPFKMQSGESLNEYLFKNRALVYLWDGWSEEDKTGEIYSFHKYFWPCCLDDYIEFSNQLINDKELLRDVLEKREPFNKEALKRADKTFVDVIGS